MPQNCSSDVQAVIAYLDHIYGENDTAAMQSLKEAFGLGGLSHIDDFAAARKSPSSRDGVDTDETPIQCNITCLLGGPCSLMMALVPCSSTFPMHWKSRMVLVHPRPAGVSSTPSTRGDRFGTTPIMHIVSRRGSHHLSASVTESDTRSRVCSSMRNCRCRVSLLT